MSGRAEGECVEVMVEEGDPWEARKGRRGGKRVGVVPRASP